MWLLAELQLLNAHDLTTGAFDVNRNKTNKYSDMF